MASRDRRAIVVLVVEDEAMIRMDAVDMLSDAGFTAIEAANADLALAILESRSDVEVVFTDVNMPGSLDGVELRGRIRQRWPYIGVIITSGMVRLSASGLTERDVFFPKPYDHGHLVKSIEALVQTAEH